MQVDATPIPGLWVLTPKRFGDGRGYFTETWNRNTLAAQGIEFDFVQDNESLSTTVGTLRGLHLQTPPFAQAKLVRCVQGAIFDVAVDARRNSPSYGKWYGAELSAENGRQLLIPAGFLHGFVTRASHTLVSYKCSAVYAPDCECAVRFDDPDLAIDWGLGDASPTLSDKDSAAGRFTALKAGPATAGTEA
ncbi:MAG: dTDP-4-dehydrorhamnose 3,5-epimerase [Rhodobacteraceae bacterium]|nr:dTDP-4-dehydrorhamnose 3,5-epimerase [Paracoccaceae bacterium]